ncbi:hypothetical protein ACRFZU_000521 [Escherichia coli]|nr:hypothetical protein [Klebsiella quasipneumoniae subsp. quasipneumoniae]
MAKNNQMIFEITGDESGLQRSLKNAGNGLNQFGDKAGGVIGDVSKRFTGGLATISTGLIGLTGGLAAAAVAVGGLILKTNDLVRELNQIAKQSGLSVTELQKLQKAFRETGFDVEKFGDINQDALDKLSDAYRNGGGIADDMISVGLDPKKYSKFLNDPDGGLKAVIQAYYDLKAAGASVGDQKFFLESWASDASKLTGVLDESKDSAEAWNRINKQNVAVTEDQARAYAEFDKNLSTLQNTSQDYLIKGLTPIIQATNNLIDAYTKEAPDTLFDSLKNKALATYDVLKYLSPNYYLGKVVGAGLDATGLFPDNKQPQTQPQVNNTLPVGQATVSTGTNEADDPFKLREKQEKEAEARRKAAEAAANKAETLRKQLEAKRIQAEKVLQQTLNGIASNGAIAQVQEFKYQQDEIEKRIRDSAKTLGKTEEETTDLLKQQYDNRKRLFKEMVDSMLAESDPKKLAQNISAIGGSVDGKGLTGILSAQDARLGLPEDPFKMSADQSTLDKIQTDGEAELALNKSLYEQKLLSYQQYQDRMVAINDSTTQKMEQANIDAQQKTLSMYALGAENLGTALSGVFGESNAAAVAAFAVSKGIAIAQSIINIQQGISEAMKLGWPAGIPAGLKVAAEGANIISTIKGTKIQGQAHDGWDSLPSTGTYNLEKGERVVGKSLNQDLTKYLSNQGNNTGGDIKVEAPLIIQNSGELTPEKFQSMCDTHATTVLQAVRKAQKQNV